MVWQTLKRNRIVIVLLLLVTAAVLIARCGEPTEEGAEAFVVEAFNNPLYVDEWWYDSFQTSDGMPPEVIDDAWGRVKLKGDCAVLRIRNSKISEISGELMTGVVFLHWDGEEWYPTDYANSTAPMFDLPRLGYYNPDAQSCYSPLDLYPQYGGG